MSISITFTGETQAEVFKAAEAFLGLKTAAANVSSGDSGKEEATTSRRGRKATDEGGKEEKQKDEGPDYTVDQIRELASKIESDADQDKAIELISDNGAESISDLAKKSAAVRVKVYEGIKAILEGGGKGRRKALD